MPDGDIIHNKLARLYQKPYKFLCEGKASASECTRAILKALKLDLKNKGNLPVILAQRMSEKLTQTLTNNASKNGSIDWATLNTDLEEIVLQSGGSHNVKELSLSASKVFIHELRYRRLELDAKNASEAIVQHYMNGVYESEFKERIPLTSEHYAGVDENTLTKRIEETEPDIRTVISAWAEKANADKGLANLRLPPRRQLDQVDLDEDLCIAS